MRETFDLWIKNTLRGMGFPLNIELLMIEIIYLLATILLSLIVYVVSKQIILRILRKLAAKTKTKNDDIILESKGTLSILYLIPALIVYYVVSFLPVIKTVVQLVLIIYISFMTVSAISSFLDVVNTIYDKKYSATKQKPIKGFIKIVKIVVFLIAIVVVVSRLLGQSPLIILSGLGAMSAIVLLIFRDSILGMVAGIQIASNDLVRIGDWIEMPKYGADGDVVDISITVVKVENFDRTITTIPSYALVSDSFKNWRGMQNSGGRRIKRAINLDMSSIGFCSEEQLKELSKIEYLIEYLKTRQQEIDKYNQENNIDASCFVNGRRLTNIGVFRQYIKEYLQRHPKIHKGMIVMVRQLPPGKDGVPMEVYAFTNDTKWENYEGIMADIFDHLFAIVPFFGLRIFQEPSGSDLKSLKH